MKKILPVVLMLLLGVACKKDVKINLDIPGNEKYSQLYMPLAVDAVVERPLSITDSAQKITYSAFLGGTKTAQQNIHVTFSVEPALVDDFNAKNGTNYALLPADSYSLETTDAVIPAGSNSTGALALSIKTQGFIEPFQSYMLPVGISDNATASINDALKTTYYVITGSYAPGEVPRAKALSLGDSAGTILFDFNGSLIRLQPSNGALLLYPEMENGEFGEPRAIGQGWNIFNMVFYYGGNRLIGRWNDSGNLTQYNIDANGNFGASATVGFGWNIFTKIIPYKGALLGVDAAGNMTMYPLEEGGFNFGKIKSIGSGWQSFTQLFAYGNSLLAIDTNGDMYQYPLSEEGEFGNRKKVGSGWDMYQLVITSGTDLLALDADGELWRYKFNPAGLWPLKK